MGLFSSKKKAPKKSEKIEMITDASAGGGGSSHNQLNEQVLHYIHEGVVIIASNGRVLLANPAAAKMFGRSVDEIENFTYDTSICLLDKTGQQIPDDKNPISYALKTGQYGETRSYDLVTLDSNKVTPVSIIIVAAEDNSKNLIVTFRDIAEELKKEEERNDFISTASHEMRTPVASIEGYLSLALNPATATIDQRANDYITKAHEASQHLGRLFRELLDTTKMDDNQMRARMEPVELVALTKQIADEQIPNISAKGLGYQFGSTNVDQTLGGSRMIDQLVYTSVDTGYLHEIVDNLVENAIKYTPEGWITVSVKADDRNAIIIVKDTGLGMPREELGHIFQKFYRVDNRDTREIGGTGLGLYLVKKRVEAMNGRIWAESEPGKGSTFFVSFPRISSEVYRQQRFALDNQTMMQRPQNKQSSTQDALVQQIIASATPNPSAPTTQVAPEEPVEDAAQTAHAQAVAENPNVVAPPQPVMPTPIIRSTGAAQLPEEKPEDPATPAVM